MSDSTLLVVYGHVESFRERDVSNVNLVDEGEIFNSRIVAKLHDHAYFPISTGRKLLWLYTKNLEKKCASKDRANELEENRAIA